MTAPSIARCNAELERLTLELEQAKDDPECGILLLVGWMDWVAEKALLEESNDPRRG